MAESIFEFTEETFPTDLTSPAGMQVVFGDRNEEFAAYYTPNVVYANYGDRSLNIQLITPAGRGPFPLLVFIQGSAFFPQNLYSNIPQLSEFAHRGFVVASIEYRHSLEAKFPAQIQDVKTAIRYMKANHEKYKVDIERVAVWGDSSGGLLASMVGVSEGVMEFETDFYHDQTSRVKAVVNFYGASDMLQMNKYPSNTDHDAPESPASTLIGAPIQENKEKARLTNPINYISKDKMLPPFLIMHGDKDDIVPFNQSVLIYEALKETQHDVTFYKVKGAGHGRGVWTKEILDIVYNFLRAHI
ncbi:hypothetical protein AMS62_25800 [Bacillus sp. FJAT-18019]|nr:hypothetical protein AMS62_25800 [Bacillus sp. FJAT-18019]